MRAPGGPLKKWSSINSVYVPQVLAFVVVLGDIRCKQTALTHHLQRYEHGKFSFAIGNWFDGKGVHLHPNWPDREALRVLAAPLLVLLVYLLLKHGGVVSRRKMGLLVFYRAPRMSHKHKLKSCEIPVEPVEFALTLHLLLLRREVEIQRGLKLIVHHGSRNMG